MGLRINTNVAAVTANRNLRLSDRNQTTSLERLSTGLRINRASDDPSGLVISEQLRAQIRSLDQALTNTENGSNLIGTAEAALAEISNLLVNIRESAIFALNTGGTSPDQIAAEQDAVDAAIQAIDRIASATRFASNQLLDGTAEIRPTNASDALHDINVRSIQFDGLASRTITIDVVSAATRASSDTTTSAAMTTVAGGDAVFRVSGNRGTTTITLGDNSTGDDLYNAVNLVALNTGVYMSKDAASNIFIKSIDYGSDVKISLEQVSGSGVYAGAEFNQLAGTDTNATINGARVNARGNYISLATKALDMNVTLDPLSGAGTYDFTVIRGGLNFQMGEKATPADSFNIGIRSVAAAFLGEEEVAVDVGGGNTITLGGFLSTLAAGGKNDLFSEPGNATRIVDRAIDEVSDLRAFLGAAQHDVMDPNIRSLGVAMENLTKSESDIRDLDFAAETANFTRTQVLFQAGISVLASANQIPSAVLSLLQ